MEKRSHHLIFSHRVFVGISSFMYDILEIEEMKDNISTIRKVPFYISSGGDEQLMRDLFMDHDKYKNELSCKIDGNITTIPRGVISFKGYTIESSNLIHGYNKIVYTKEVEGDFSNETREFMSLGEWVPLTYNFDVKIKCSNETQRLNIIDSLTDELYKARVFYFSYLGFNRLRATVEFPESYNGDRQIPISYGNVDNNPEITFQVVLKVYKPVIDEATEYHINSTIKKSIINYGQSKQNDTGGSSPV